MDCQCHCDNKAKSRYVKSSKRKEKDEKNALITWVTGLFEKRSQKHPEFYLLKNRTGRSRGYVLDAEIQNKIISTIKLMQKTERKKNERETPLLATSNL